MAKTATKVDTNGDGETDDKAFRLSITLDPSLRRHMRIAAALADKTVGEWAADILERYADKAAKIAEEADAEG